MIVIVVGDTAFRLRNDGILESSIAYGNAKGFIVKVEEFELPDAKKLDMTGGDLETIKEAIERLAILFPPDRGPLPSSETYQPLRIVPEGAL